MNKPRLKDVLDAIRRAMADAGFAPVDGTDIYCTRIGDSILGWVGLTTEVESDGVKVAVKVGVRHEHIHELVDEVRGRSSSGAPTVSRMLGYFMPQQTANVVWCFVRETETDDQARDLVTAIVTYGRPYMDSLAEPEALIDALHRAAPWEYSQMRIPAALALAGRDDAARAFLTEELAKLGDRTDPAAESFREFAGRFPNRAHQD